MDEEAGGSKFVECKISQIVKGSKRVIVNMLKFVELPAGELPPDLTLEIKRRAEPPKPEWEGAMLVDGTTSLVYLYRP